ncbi:hypothetical protein BCR42DRAFT_411331 [Absidia repens]|uniref:Uncharacterized protein n=1 Tax=Absidia repens TaxID=90262 RepID=A0A1X2IN03_9FUNG|nr:hypothetical protein BCR42DRAFT_411331 [Absidia repens]
MASPNFISFFRKMSKLLPSCRSQEKNQPSAASSSSASASSIAKETFIINDTAGNNHSPLRKRKNLHQIHLRHSHHYHLHDIDSSPSPVFPWMTTPVPSTAWAFRTGFTPQPDSSAISALYWCPSCDMHMQGTVDDRCEWCDMAFLLNPSSSPIPPPKKKGKWSRSLGRFFLIKNYSLLL